MSRFHAKTTEPIKSSILKHYWTQVGKGYILVVVSIQIATITSTLMQYKNRNLLEGMYAYYDYTKCGSADIRTVFLVISLL